MEKIVAKPDSYIRALHDFDVMNYGFLTTEFRDLGEVQKIWIDPKDVQAPIKLENVFWLRLYPGACCLPEKFIAKMQEIGAMMTNIENLDVPIVNQRTLSWILNLTNLKKIQLSFDYGDQRCATSSLLDMVNVLGTMENLQILDCAIQLNFLLLFSADYLDEQETKDMLENAMKIIDQKLLNEIVFIKDYDYGFEVKKDKNRPCQLTPPPSNW